MEAGRRRTIRVGGLLLFLLLFLGGVLGSIAFGSRSIPLGDVITALSSWSSWDPSPLDPSIDQHIIVDLRIPRTVLAVAVGAALGTAGALLQGHTRNPLADPGLLGISAGAALAVVTGFSVFGVTSTWATSIWAFTGAISSTAIVFTLSSIGGGRLNPLNVILSGAALSAVLMSITSSIILTNRASLAHLRQWTVGALDGRDLSVALGVLPFIAVGLIGAFATGPHLNLLTMGDDVALSLGINTQRARFIGMCLIALLSGAATAAAGPLGFVALLVPHIARSLTGPDFRWLLPYSALIGINLLLYADILGRLIARPAEVQVGIMMAFVGAPFFIALISRRRVLKL